MKAQKIPNHQDNNEEKSNAKDNITYYFKIHYRAIVTTYHMQGTGIKYIHRPVKQNREPRNKPTKPQLSVSFRVAKKTTTLINGAGKMDSHLKKLKLDPYSHPV